MRAFGFVVHLGDFGSVFARGAFDGVLDIFFREIRSLRVLDRYTEGSVGFRIGAAVFRSEGDRFREFRENFG